MKSPFGNIDDAFAPMFDENVAVKTVEGKETNLRACMFIDGDSDPLADDMMETERDDMIFMFQKKDWPFVQTLKRGAEIRRCSCSKKYSVSEAKLDNIFGWVVKAREK